MSKTRKVRRRQKGEKAVRHPQGRKRAVSRPVEASEQGISDAMLAALKRQGLASGLDRVSTPPNQVRMSEVLAEFIKPLLVHATDIKQAEMFVMLAAAGWNTALLPADKREQLFAEVIGRQPPDLRDGLVTMINAFVERKQQFFAGYGRFILSVTVTERDDGFDLEVASLPGLEEKEG